MTTTTVRCNHIYQPYSGPIVSARQPNGRLTHYRVTDIVIDPTGRLLFSGYRYLPRTGATVGVNPVAIYARKVEAVRCSGR